MTKLKFSQLLIILVIIFPLLTTSAQDLDCSDCHEIELKGVHLDALECVDCHSDIDDEEHSENGADKVNCADCHDEYVNSVNRDIHHRIVKSKRNPTCKSCHGLHSIYSPSRYQNKTKQYCYKCHSDRNVILTLKYHSEKIGNDKCFDCHDEEDYKPELHNSVHSNLNCADCHSYAAQNLEMHDEGIEKTQRADCNSCHNDVTMVLEKSIHGIKANQNNEDAPMCWSCHGSHNILSSSNSSSRTNSMNIGKTCGACHDNPDFEKKNSMAIKLPGKMYSKSVHGKLVLSGNKDAANCTSCHGFHDIKDRVMENSEIAPVNIPQTCGKCHEKIEAEYKNSIHWARAKKGVKEAPVCNDCHNEHSIESFTEANRDEFRLKMQKETCINCHSNKQMNQKFGNSGKEVFQYLNSYHGLAANRGGKKVALCIDCHSVHSILPSSDSSSSINKANVTNTCRKCHKDATETFAKSYSHETESSEAKQVEDIVREIYFWLIIVVIGGMVLHNLIIFFSELRRKRRKEKNVITVPRFTKNEVLQHFLLLTSFITLAITGFALKYPNSFWSEGLLSLGMTEAVRSTIHRTAAVIMGISSIYHFFYLLFTARGRNILYEMLPTSKDLKDVIDNMLYYLRIKKKHPHFNQYDYAEKAEYWALIWGTLVMGLTGFFLWFPIVVDEWAPIWLIKVSEIIHFYEAILATLAIIVWHWFFVILHPKEYPMSFTWIDGKMSLRHYREHHENHFRKLLLEWDNFRKGNIKKEELNHFTKLFLETIEKHGANPDEVLQNELNNDPELFVWLDSVTSSQKN